MSVWSLRSRSATKRQEEEELVALPAERSAYGIDMGCACVCAVECACLLHNSKMRAPAASVASKMPLLVLNTHDMLHVL